MIRKVLIVFTTLAVAMASAATYRVKLLEPTRVSGTTLKAGEYKVEVGRQQGRVQGRKTYGGGRGESGERQ